MPFSTSDFSATDFRERFGEQEWQALTQRGVSDGGDNTGAGDVDEEGERAAVFASALEDSLAEVNSRIAAQLARLDTAPALIKMVLADLVRARLYADSPTQVVVKRQTEARRILEDVAQGRRQLDPATTLHSPAVSAPPSVFTDNSLSSFKA